jgi:hypothetical protein
VRTTFIFIPQERQQAVAKYGGSVAETHKAKTFEPDEELAEATANAGDLIVMISSTLSPPLVPRCGARSMMEASHIGMQSIGSSMIADQVA